MSKLTYTIGPAVALLLDIYTGPAVRILAEAGSRIEWPYTLRLESPDAAQPPSGSRVGFERFSPLGRIL